MNLNRTIPNFTMVDIQASRKIQRTKQQRFHRRYSNFIKRANGLHVDCEVDVYVLVRKKNKNHTYNSSSDPTWPPPHSDIVTPTSQIVIVPG